MIRFSPNTWTVHLDIISSIRILLEIYPFAHLCAHFLMPYPDYFTLFFSTVFLGLHLTLSFLYPTRYSQFLYLEMTLNTSNLLPDFLSLTQRTWKELEWERRDIFKGPAEMNRKFHVATWIVDMLAVLVFVIYGREKKRRSKHLEVLIT